MVLSKSLNNEHSKTKQRRFRMKKILIAWIAVLFIVCIVANFVARRPEKKEVAAVTPKVAKAVIPEKKTEPVEKPRVAEEPKIIEEIARIETEKPEEVEKPETKISELEGKIRFLQTESRIRTQEDLERVNREIAGLKEKVEFLEYQQAEIQRYEPEESVYYGPVAHYWRPFIYPLWFDFALNPFWYWYSWDWHYTGLYSCSYFWSWHPLWSWTRVIPLHYDYYAGYYARRYDPFYRGGRAVVRKTQFKDPHYQSRNLRSSAISSSALTQTNQISKTSIGGYPSRIASRGDRSISQKRSSTATGYPVKPRSYASDSRFSRSPSASREMPLRPNSFSGTPRRTANSFRSASPSRSFSRPSSSFRSVGSFRSSPSIRSAPSRSSGSIRRK